MRKSLIAIVLLSSPIWAADSFQPLNVKTGLWESTSTVTVNGQIGLPEDMLSKLTPEQRARYEARMQANAGGRTTTHTNQSCLTPEKLNHGTLFDDKEMGCRQTVLNSNSSKLELHVVCQNNDMSAQGTLQIEALNSESVKGSGTMSITSQSHTMNSKTSLTAKWVGASCGSVQ